MAVWRGSMGGEGDVRPTCKLRQLLADLPDYV